MKNFFLNTAIGKIGGLFLLFVAITFIGGGFILNGLLRMPATLANSIVVVAMLVITYKVYKKEGQDLSTLGTDLRWRHLRFALTGFLIGGLFVFPLVYAFAFIKGYPVIFNANFSSSYVLKGLLLVLPAVLLEELAFRGICFEKTVRLAGVKNANIIFASVFILSHWLNMQSFNGPQMFVLLITGLGHILYATAFLRSGTLFFPIGLHFGNNWVSNFVFSTTENHPAGLNNLSLIEIITNGELPVFDKQFFLTTFTTALLFILLIQCLRMLKGRFRLN